MQGVREISQDPRKGSNRECTPRRDPHERGYKARMNRAADVAQREPGSKQLAQREQGSGEPAHAEGAKEA